jgi:hypothetical protein
MRVRIEVWTISVVWMGGALGCSGAAVGSRSHPSDAGTPSPSGVGDASADEDALCAQLQSTATTQFEPILNQNLGCSADTDCVHGAAADTCVAPCGTLTSDAGAAAVQTAADTLCQPFLAAGCKVPFYGCPVSGTTICAGGGCTTYGVVLSPYPPPSLDAGGCMAFQLSYYGNAGPDVPPHDITVSVRANGGMLYADGACTTPLTGDSAAGDSVVIPAGTKSVPLGYASPDGGPAYGITVGTEFYNLASPQ